MRIIATQSITDDNLRGLSMPVLMVTGVVVLGERRYREAAEEGSRTPGSRSSSSVSRLLLALAIIRNVLLL